MPDYTTAAVMFASGVVTGAWCYKNINRIGSYLLDLYVDLKYLFTETESPTSTSALPPPRTGPETIWNETYRVRECGNFMQWTTINDDFNQPDQNLKWHGNSCTVFEVTNHADHNKNTLLLNYLSKLAGPDGDFTGKIPPLELLEALVGHPLEGEQIILLNPDTYEEHIIESRKKN